MPSKTISQSFKLQNTHITPVEACCLFGRHQGGKWLLFDNSWLIGWPLMVPGQYVFTRNFWYDGEGWIIGSSSTQEKKRICERLMILCQPYVLNRYLKAHEERFWRRNPLCLFVWFFVSKQLALNQGGSTLKGGVSMKRPGRGDGEERPGLRLDYPYHSCPRQ
jgi:hypothetical protein